MSTRVAAVLWLVLGVAVWNGFFDLYVSRGAREYRELLALHELGRGPNPDMMAVQDRNIRAGLVGASIWSVIVVSAGWTTLWLSRRSRR